MTDEKKTNNYVTGRNRETARLRMLQRTNKAVLGGRFRGSKQSKSWINHLKFNPKLDLWWIDYDGVVHFEQYKTSQAGRKPYISKDETASVQSFADIFNNFPTVWVGIITKESYKESKELRLN